MADLTPKPGGLYWLSPEEWTLVRALRADPDQERHIADCHWNDRGGIAVTVRHPITERVLADDALFTCPVLPHAIAWLEDEDEPGGRWRLDGEGATWSGSREGAARPGPGHRAGASENHAGRSGAAAVCGERAEGAAGHLPNPHRRGHRDRRRHGARAARGHHDLVRQRQRPLVDAHHDRADGPERLRQRDARRGVQDDLPMKNAIVIGDPVRRYGLLWRAPLIELHATGLQIIRGWGGWSRTPDRAEVRALGRLRRLRQQQR